jgi:hypothetical protein
VGLERGPLSLVSITEELFERKSSGSGLENRDYGRRGSATPFYPKKLALTFGSDMAVRVSALRSRRASPLRKIPGNHLLEAESILGP